MAARNLAHYALGFASMDALGFRPMHTVSSPEIGRARPEVKPVPSDITCVQPGRGWVMRLEMAWGKVRRWWLRSFRPGYVARMERLRKGECPNCPHDIADPRDLKFYRNVCGFYFSHEDDPFRWRGQLGVARVGWAEILLFSSLLALIV